MSGCISSKPAAASETTSKGLASDYAPEAVAAVALDTPASAPPERDDKNAPIVRLAVFGSSSQPVGVPYFYGYPLYAEGTAVHGVRLLRHDNWSGMERTEQPSPEGVAHVSEVLPALDCELRGVQEDVGRFVPLELECVLPPAKGRNARAAIGDVFAGARLEQLLAEPSIRKAFLGELHAKSPGLDGGDGVGYFDTPHGLLGFGFKSGKLATVSFTFAPSQANWRAPELWSEPIQ